MRVLRLLFLASTGLSVLAGCSDLPTAGPSKAEIADRFTPANNPLGVRMVELGPAVARAVAQTSHASLRELGPTRGTGPTDRIGAGDTLAISIYEAGPGLFAGSHAADMSGLSNTNAGLSPGGGGTSVGAAGGGATTAETLPRMLVDRSGRITIPYVGEITVAGRTPSQVQQIIQGRLAGKAAQPQVLVSVLGNTSNTVFLSGDVHKNGRVPLGVANESVSDIVTLGGGPTHSPQDTTVRVTRHGRDAEEVLADLQAYPADDIAVEPHDHIHLTYDPRTFLVFGATGKVAQEEFRSPHLSLAEAVARSGGLDDQRADPDALYLFRFENPVVLRAMGETAPNAPVPVIYHINMRDPQNFFLLQSFAMHNKDLIYVANARSVQLYKFLQIINSVFTPVVYSRAAAGN